MNIENLNIENSCTARSNEEYSLYFKARQVDLNLLILWQVLGRFCCICIFFPNFFKHHHITAKAFLLLLIYLQCFEHMVFGKTGSISIGNDVSINISPQMFFVKNLSFIPVEHPHLVKSGTGIANKNKLVPGSAI